MKYQKEELLAFMDEWVDAHEETEENVNKYTESGITMCHAFHSGVQVFEGIETLADVANCKIKDKGERREFSCASEQREFRYKGVLFFQLI